MGQCTPFISSFGRDVVAGGVASSPKGSNVLQFLICVDRCQNVHRMYRQQGIRSGFADEASDSGGSGSLQQQTSFFFFFNACRYIDRHALSAIRTPNFCTFSCHISSILPFRKYQWAYLDLRSHKPCFVRVFEPSPGSPILSFWRINSFVLSQRHLFSLYCRFRIFED